MAKKEKLKKEDELKLDSLVALAVNNMNHENINAFADSILSYMRQGYDVNVYIDIYKEVIDEYKRVN